MAKWVNNAFHLNARKKAISILIGSTLILLVIIGSGLLINQDDIAINLLEKNLSPSTKHLFGTDWLGRDMLLRTIKGLTLSFGVGILAAFSSTVIALLLSIFSSWNSRADSMITWLIDLFLSVPHLVILILISFSVGGGFKGVVLGLSLTHWPALTRLLRAEVMQIKDADYVSLSKKIGKPNLWIMRHHFLPHLLPQLAIGFTLLFPHAILHEAAITFLGFGLSSESPAIGIILSESMKYLSVGRWWLAFFPGLSLLFMVNTFDRLFRNARRLVNPLYSQGGIH